MYDKKTLKLFLQLTLKFCFKFCFISLEPHTRSVPASFKLLMHYRYQWCIHDSIDVKIEDGSQQPEATGNTTASKEMRETVEWRRVFGQMKAKHQNIFHK